MHLDFFYVCFEPYTQSAITIDRLGLGNPYAWNVTVNKGILFWPMGKCP